MKTPTYESLLKVADPVARHFCYEMGLGPTQFKRLCDRAGKAAEWQAATTDPDNIGGRMVAEFERYAAKFGFSVMWPGLYPLITKSGRSVTVSEDGIG
jgi:hypothetical protein